jgi:hypothetical protein
MELVVPQTKTIKLGPEAGGVRGLQETFALDIIVQSEADINNLIVGTTEQTLIEQASINNYASRLTVDGVDNKPLSAAQKKASALFGQGVNQLLIGRIERTLAAEIRDTTQTRTGRLSNVRANWQWIFISREGGKTQPGVPVNPRAPGFNWFYGDTLVLVPKRVLNDKGQMYASTVNTLVAQRRPTTVTPTRGKNKGVPSQRNWGFARRTTRKVKRTARFSAVTVWAGHTSQHLAKGEIYKPKPVGRKLTLFIAMTNRAKRTTGSGYRNFD